MKYFLDTVNGSDANTGLTSTDPWQSPAKIKAALADRTIGYGDEVRIACGSRISEPMFTSSFPVDSRRTGEKLIFGAYGAGDKPVFDLYKYANEPEFWTEITTNIWEINLAPNNGTHTGNVAAPGNNIGHLLIDGEYFGYEKSGDSEMGSQWDYFSERSGTLLRVYSVGNPADRTVSFGIAPPQNGMSVRHDTIVEGIRIDGPGYHGFNTNLQNSKLQNFDVVGCDFIGGGGSHIPATGPRVGNAWQVWAGAENVSVRFCVAEQWYDVAATCQGDIGLNQQGYINVEFRGNVIRFCGQAFEIWYRDTTGFGFRDVRFVDNDVIGSGWGWSYGPRSDKGKGVDILTYALRLVTDVEIAGNRFIGARDGYCYHNDATGSYKFPDGVRRRDNTIAGYLGKFVQYDERYVFGGENGWAEWAAVHDTEQGSVFYTIAPGDDIGSKMSNTEVAAGVGVSRVGFQPAPVETHRANITPRYAAGRWYDFGYTTDTALTFNQVGAGFGRAFVADFDGTIDGAGVIVTTGAAGAAVRFAVYEESVTGVFYRIGNLGAASASAAGQCQVILGAGGVRVRKGIRYIVFAAPIGAGVVVQGATLMHDPTVSANTLANLAASRFAGYTIAGITGDNYPETIAPPLVGVSSIPFIGVRFK